MYLQWAWASLMKSLAGGVLGEQGGRVGRGEDDHGVVEDGWAAVDLLVGWHELSVAGDDAADLWGDEFDECPFGGRRLAQRRQQRRVGAVGDQRADLAAGEAVRPVEDDAQRR